MIAHTAASCKVQRVAFCTPCSSELQWNAGAARHSGCNGGAHMAASAAVGSCASICQMRLHAGRSTVTQSNQQRVGPQTCNGVANGDRDHVVDNVSAHRHWRAQLDAKGNLQAAAGKA